MNKKLILFGSILAVVILVLASMTSVVGTNVSDELVEITTEIYGINGVKSHSVKLVKDDVQEIEKLFDNIHTNLKKTETREETIEIFDEAIYELDKYNLLGDLSVNEVQRLVNGGHWSPKVLKLIDILCSRNQKFRDNVNFLCSIEGETTNTRIFGSPKTFAVISLGYYGTGLHGWPCAYPAEGHVYTNGRNGVKEWDGSLYGQSLFINILLIYGLLFFDYIGVIGFTGIAIEVSGEKMEYFGSALWARIRTGT